MFQGTVPHPIEGYTIPVKEPPRRVPFGLSGRLRQKLNKLEEQNVIQKMDEPTDWVNNLVIVEKKDGTLRLCLDPRELNKAIKREHFQLPTLEDVTSSLGGKNIFTVVDLKDAFWQVPLTEDSAPLTTFSTPFGRYCFRRMPFGICSASEVMQKRVYRTFGDLNDVHVIADDLIIGSNTEEEADEAIHRVFQRAREVNIKFNLAKIQLKKREVTYMGNIIGQYGVRPDPAKVEAITQMPTPGCRKDIQRLIGMLNYLSQYIPDMSTITAPVRVLLKADIPFEWCSEQDEAMSKIKEILSSEPTLRLYDVELPALIQCDASKTGIGACLMQQGQPVAYYSRALTPTEQNWFPIEKECLAVVCAAERFQQYIYGREVEVKSDHKPLEMITRKSIHKASPRIQAMLLRLMKYNLYVNYQPGPTMYIADALSRAYIEEKEVPQELELDTSMRIHTLVSNLPMSDTRLKDVRSATLEDPTHQQLTETVMAGWPRYRKDCNPLISQYWPLRDEIHVIDGIVLMGERIIIPISMRQEMLEKLHESHLGMDKCRARARAVMYWPAMSRDINELVAKCSTCMKYRRENTREPLISHEVPLRPWQKLGADIFDYGGKAYLIVVDYFSKYPEVCALQGKSASAVIKHFKSVFSRHGLPEVLVADNMPFNSCEMRQFAAEYCFTIKTSSPEHAQSNGQSERMIGTVKQLMRKAQEENRDPHLALLAYRNSPVAGMPYSPAELLMSRKLRDKLPAAEPVLTPKVAKGAYTMLKRRQTKAKKYFDRGTRQLPEVDIGDTVRVKSGRTWAAAVVSSKHEAPRSYIVTTENGQTYRRNRKWLHKSLEPPPTFLRENTEESGSTQHDQQHTTTSQMAGSPTPPLTKTNDRNTRPPSVQTPRPPSVQTPRPPSVQTPSAPSVQTPRPTTLHTPRRESSRQRRPPIWMSDYMKT